MARVLDGCGQERGERLAGGMVGPQLPGQAGELPQPFGDDRREERLLGGEVPVRVRAGRGHLVFARASEPGLPLNPPGPQERPWHGGWPDWRNGNPADLREHLGWPVAGALFDVEYNNLWHPSWGRRPARLVHALGTARRRLGEAPTLIPVYAHRYLPAGGGTHGHPVLSIHQTDIIIYGTDIADYIANEFIRSRLFISPDWTPPPMVRFWSEFAFG